MGIYYCRKADLTSIGDPIGVLIYLVAVFAIGYLFSGGPFWAAAPGTIIGSYLATFFIFWQHSDIEHVERIIKTAQMSRLATIAKSLIYRRINVTI
mgnify:CR=1 FL=1